MWEDIWYEINKFSAIIFIFLVPSCILGGLFWRRFPPAIKVLVVFLWFDLFIEIGSRLMPYWVIDPTNKRRTNLPLVHIQTLGQIILWPLFYGKIMQAGSIYRKYNQWLIGAGVLLVMLNTLFLQGIYTFNSYAITLVQVVVIMLALDYAFNFATEFNADKSFIKVLKRINAAVLLYYCGSLFIFMFSNYSTHTWENGYELLWDINVFLNFIFYLVVFLGLCNLITKPRM